MHFNFVTKLKLLSLSPLLELIIDLHILISSRSIFIYILHYRVNTDIIPTSFKCYIVRLTKNNLLIVFVN